MAKTANIQGTDGRSVTEALPSTFLARSELTKIRTGLRIHKQYEPAMLASRLIEQLEVIDKPGTPEDRRAVLWQSYRDGRAQLLRAVEKFQGED